MAKRTSYTSPPEGHGPPTAPKGKQRKKHILLATPIPLQPHGKKLGWACKIPGPCIKNMRGPGCPGRPVCEWVWGGGEWGPFAISSTSQARLESSGVHLCTHALAPHSAATVRYRFLLLLTTSLAATLTPNAGSAHAKGGQVMLRPRPLLELPCKAERWQRAHKRRTSNVSPSTITSAP